MTASFYAAYHAVFTQVQTDLAAKASIKAVNLGEELRLTALPLAIINPERTAVEIGAMGSELHCRVGFVVIVVVRETQPVNLFADIVSVMADVFDAIVADHTLGGAVIDVYPTAFAPGEIKIQNKLFYGGAVRFEAQLEFQP